MKKAFILFLPLLLVFNVKAQQPVLHANGPVIINPHKNFPPAIQSPQQQTAFSLDTLDYFFNKQFFLHPTASNQNLAFLTINSPYASTANVSYCGGIFNSYSQLIVNGLEALVALKAPATSTNVSVKLYLCNLNGANLPVMPPVDSVQCPVTSTSGSWVGADFNSPISMNGRFAVLAKIGSTSVSDTISLFLNNACAASSTAVPAYMRYGEGLGLLRFNGVFYHTTGIFGTNPPGNDYEFVVAPRVGFSFNAAANVLTPSVCPSTPASFTNATTPTRLVDNAQFNFNMFVQKWQPILNGIQPSTDSVFKWVFSGAATTTLYGSNPQPVFNTSGNQTTKLYVNYRKSAHNAAFFNDVKDSANASITVLNAPAVTVSVPTHTSCVLSANGSTIAATGSPAGGTFSGVNLTSNGVFSPNTPGVFIITYSYTDNLTGCFKSVTTNINVNSCTGLNEEAVKGKLSLYPNPAATAITLKGIEDAASVLVYDMTGKLIFQTKTTATEQLEIPISEIPNGVYQLSVREQNGDLKSLKFVKQAAF